MAGNLGFTAFVVCDATATFDRTGPDGVEYKAELIQAMTLSDLNHEFATIVDTKGAIDALNGAPHERHASSHSSSSVGRVTGPSGG